MLSFLHSELVCRWQALLKQYTPDSVRHSELICRTIALDMSTGQSYAFGHLDSDLTLA